MAKFIEKQILFIQCLGTMDRIGPLGHHFFVNTFSSKRVGETPGVRRRLSTGIIYRDCFGFLLMIS